MSGPGKRNWKDHEESLVLPTHINLHEEEFGEEDVGSDKSDLAVIISVRKLNRDKLYEYIDFLELVYATSATLHVYKNGSARISVEVPYRRSYVGFKVAGWLYKIPWSIYQKTSRGRS